jgi:hypothetical protein
MPRMRRLFPLLPLATLILAACSGTESDKQWYKPNVDYTAADFDRDRVACTDKKKVLDEECMKKRGWATLGGDIGPSVKPPDPTKAPSGPKGRY